MFQSCKVTLPPNVIQNEYAFHHNHFEKINNFREFIIQHNELSTGSFDEYGNATIKYNKLFRNNEPIYGIYKNWTLKTFTTQHQSSNNNKKRKKYKSRRKIHIKRDGRSYDEDTMRNGNIKITKKMSIEIIPNIMKEKHIKNIFSYMSKSSTLNPSSSDGKIWILNLGLTDKNTNKYIYFIGDRIPGNTPRSYTWKMRDNIYTAQQIIKLTQLNRNQLPMAMKDRNEFKSKLQNIYIMEQMLNDKKIQEILFNTKVKWENVPVFTNEKETNKTQLHLNKSKPIFIQDIKRILRDMNRIVLKPILLFNHNPDKDIYNIDGILRIKLNGNDIGISFKYNNGKMLPSGFHLDLSNILLMNQLANPSIYDNYFNQWETTINDMSIGNKDKYRNQFNAKSVECEMYKKKNEKYADIVYEMLNELNTLQKHNGIQINEKLSNLMHAGNNMLRSSKGDSKVFNTAHNTADINVPVYSNQVSKQSVLSCPDNVEQFTHTLPIITCTNIINGGNVNLLPVGMIPASMLIQTHTQTIGTVENNNINIIETVPMDTSTKLNIDAQVFIPTPNKIKLETINE